MRRALLVEAAPFVVAPRRYRAALAAWIVLAAAAPLGAHDLTGFWCDDHGTRYAMRQADTDLCWHMDGLPLVQNVFCGTLIGNFVVGRWLDLPGGQYLGGGRLILSIDSPNRLSKAYHVGGYGASRWARVGAGESCAAGLPPPDDQVRPPGGASGTGGPTTTPSPPPPPPPPSTYPASRPSAPPQPPAAYATPGPTAPGGTSSLPPRPGSWRLVGLEQRGSMDDRPATPGDGGMRFEVRRFDATGGEVLVTVTYAVPALCPQPESESILYTWSFPTDMRYLQPGQEFAVDVAVEPHSRSRTCPAGVFGRSEVVVMRSEGSVEDISAAERPGYWPLFTHPYVKDPTGVRLNFYVGGAPTGRAVLRVNDEPPPTNARRGSYSIRFWSNACCGTPSSANNWSFHYFYDY